MPLAYCLLQLGAWIMSAKWAVDNDMHGFDVAAIAMVIAWVALAATWRGQPLHGVTLPIAYLYFGVGAVVVAVTSISKASDLLVFWLPQAVISVPIVVMAHISRWREHSQQQPQQAQR